MPGHMGAVMRKLMVAAVAAALHPRTTGSPLTPGEEERLAALLSKQALERSAVTQVPSVVFLKTHKTGGSTVTNILHRLGLNYGMRQPVPNGRLFEEHKYAKWSSPGQAGKDTAAVAQMPVSTSLRSLGPPFDLWAFHSTFSLDQARWLVPKAAQILTIVREPVSQMASCTCYYSGGRDCSLSRLFASLGPEAKVMAAVGTRNAPARAITGIVGRCWNMMATDLAGVNPRKHADANADAAVEALVADLRRENTTQSSYAVMLLERLDEALALFSLDHGVHPFDMAAFPMKANKKHRNPPPLLPEPRQIAMHIQDVDVRIYNAAAEQFERRLAQRPRHEIERRLALMKWHQANLARCPKRQYAMSPQHPEKKRKARVHMPAEYFTGATALSKAFFESMLADSVAADGSLVVTAGARGDRARLARLRQRYKSFELQCELSKMDGNEWIEWGKNWWTALSSHAAESGSEMLNFTLDVVQAAGTLWGDAADMGSRA